MIRKTVLGILKKIKFLSPELYVRIYYEYYTGKKLNLKEPLEFNEKIQWIKVFYKPDILTKLVDKYAVREYVQQTIGDQYLSNLLQVTSNPSEIDFNTLPNRFVVKSTHACNFNLIVTNKKNYNKFKTRLLFKKWLARNQYYRGGLEWAYKNVPPKLIVEEYMEELGKDVLDDYKFYCFNGKPYMVQLDIARNNNHKRVFMDMAWKKLDIRKGTLPIFNGNPKKPKEFDKMIKLATKLAANFPFVRVDLYNVNNKIIFGEMTFYPGDGRQEFYPDVYNRIYGDMLTLPTIPKGQEYIKTI
jgi:hypothetical protein